MSQYNPPELILGFNDVAALRSIIRAYLTYGRRTVPPSQEREIQYHLLERLYLRLAGMHPAESEIYLTLTLSEIRALNSALVGFAGFVRQKVSPSREREETLRDVERLREKLSRLLPDQGTR